MNNIKSTLNERDIWSEQWPQDWMEYRCYATHAFWIIRFRIMRFIHSRAFLSVLLRSIFRNLCDDSCTTTFRSVQIDGLSHVYFYAVLIQSICERCATLSVEYLLIAWNALPLVHVQIDICIKTLMCLLLVETDEVIFCAWKCDNFVLWLTTLVNRFHLGK